MKFLLIEDKLQPLQFMRQLGYHPHKDNESFAKRLGGDQFPRFHVYLKKTKKGWELSLHLDQKGQSYQGHTAHSGDYDGQVLEEEKERILNQLRS